MYSIYDFLVSADKVYCPASYNVSHVVQAAWLVRVLRLIMRTRGSTDEQSAKLRWKTRVVVDMIITDIGTIQARVGNLQPAWYTIRLSACGYLNM